MIQLIIYNYMILYYALVSGLWDIMLYCDMAIMDCWILFYNVIWLVDWDIILYCDMVSGLWDIIL